MWVVSSAMWVSARVQVVGFGFQALGFNVAGERVHGVHEWFRRLRLHPLLYLPPWCYAWPGCARSRSQAMHLHMFPVALASSTSLRFIQ
jgi:hypothetical protein